MKMHAPAIPLINIDPYFSIWANESVLSNTTHWTGKTYHGRALLDRIGKAVNRAYFGTFGTKKQKEASDYMWYLWCGPDSPLYGKDKMATFERTLIEA